MLNTSVREYQNFKAAQNLCIAAYGSEELSSENIEKYESNGVWSQSNVWHIKQAQPLRSYFIGASAPTQLELLNTEEDQVKQLIARIRISPFILCQQKLVDVAVRILTLFKDAKEEDEFSVGITAGSLRSFYSFISTHSDLKRPKLSLTPENNIYASWKSGNDKIFSVHFFSNGDARFVIFKPNNRHPEKIIRISGVVTSDMLIETVKPYNIDEWVLE